MRILGTVLAVAALFLLPVRVNAISVAVGNNITGDSGTTGLVIDLNNPANATGHLTTVRFGWTDDNCPGGAKVKVFRRVGNTLTLTGERTIDIPNLPGQIFTVPLSPPLPIEEGNLIGIYATSASCVGPLFNSFPFAGTYLGTSVDVESTLTFDPTADPHPGGVVLYATGDATEYRAGVIAGVGSGPGANGSHFKTSLQMIATPIGGEVTGKLVFHPVGVGGSPADPATPFTIPQGHALAFDDVVTSMGQTGFGTLDLVLAADSSTPVTVARVFNQASNGGTAGLGEELINTSGNFAGGGLAVQVIPAGFTGFVSAPPNTENTRFNIGVRTLDSGASVQYVLKDSAGNTLANAHQLLQPNYFNQVDATVLFGLSASGIAANDYVEVSVSSGSAIVYGSSTDNTTNDPSVQFVYPVFGVV